MDHQLCFKICWTALDSIEWLLFHWAVADLRRRPPPTALNFLNLVGTPSCRESWIHPCWDNDRWHEVVSYLQEMQEKVQQLQAHVVQLKNLLSKAKEENEKSSKPRKERPFDFNKYVWCLCTIQTCWNGLRTCAPVWIPNASVRGRVSSSRTSFWTPPNLNSEVSNPKYYCFHPDTLWSTWMKTIIFWVGHFRIKVLRCPETHPRAGNSTSNWAV